MKNEHKPVTFFNIHHYMMKVYDKFNIESIQDILVALELFGYFVYICMVVPSIELALVCLVLVNKLHQDNGIKIHNILKYCDSDTVHELEISLVLLYYDMKLSHLNIIERLYESLNIVEGNILLEIVVERNLGLDTVKYIIEYGGSVDTSMVHKVNICYINEWLLKVREEYIYTVMKNTFSIMEHNVILDDETRRYLNEIREWYKSIREDVFFTYDSSDIDSDIPSPPPSDSDTEDDELAYKLFEIELSA